MDRGARYFAAIGEKTPKCFKILLLTGGIYSYIIIYTFLLILMSHVSLVVVFRLGKKTVATFRSGKLACIPLSFI